MTSPTDSIMGDQEFLVYCSSMADTPRCGFTPTLIARLLRLAGREDEAATWDRQPVQVINADREVIRGLVAEAYAERLEQDLSPNQTTGES